MKFHFDPNQQYQLDAINSIISVFEGQPLEHGDFSFTIDKENYLFQTNGVGNRLKLSEEQVLENVKSVQGNNELPVAAALDGMNFSVEMETGTGKTYVYLRTIYELNKNYGFKKFVIVVPSIAIREGVLKNLEITFKHLQNLYDKTPADFEVYDSRRVSNLRNFCVSNAIQILVINIDSFAKDTNINLLTVIANEAYEDIARQLQSEIEEDCGVSFKGRVKNKRKRKIKCGKAHFKEFDDVKYRQVATVGELDEE